MEPIRDQLVFDWVLALGSTSEAADLLDLPQSSVSRRYRSLAQQFGLTLRRQRGELMLVSDDSIYLKLRELSQIYRLKKHRFRWSWQPCLRSLLGQVSQVGENSLYIPLTHAQWQHRHDHQQQRILDCCFELCAPAEPGFVGITALPLHLQLPQQEAPTATLSALARRWPLKINITDLPASVWQTLANDGFELEAEDSGTDGLRVGFGHGTASCMTLPHRVHAGWCPPPPLEGVAFNSALLEQATAALRA